MSLPNILTITRIILTFVFVFLIFQYGFSAKVLAAIVFTLASLTDLFDGYYARKYNLITNFGKLMDPIADKFLVLAAFFVFMQMHLIATWMFLVILVREVFVTGWRLVAMRQGKVLAAEKVGKIKTVLQITTIFLILFYLIFIEAGHQASGYQYLFVGIYWLMIMVVSITLFSGFSYLWQNRKFFHA